MAETKVTKIKYVIQFYLEDLDRWSDSNWNNRIRYKSDLDNMLQFLKQARANSAEAEKVGMVKAKPYRLVKKTYSVTTEVIDE